MAENRSQATNRATKCGRRGKYEAGGGEKPMAANGRHGVGRHANDAITAINGGGSGENERVQPYGHNVSSELICP